MQETIVVDREMKKENLEELLVNTHASIGCEICFVMIYLHWHFLWRLDLRAPVEAAAFCGGWQLQRLRAEQGGNSEREQGGKLKKYKCKT